MFAADFKSSNMTKDIANVARSVLGLFFVFLFFLNQDQNSTMSAQDNRLQDCCQRSKPDNSKTKCQFEIDQN